MAHPGRGVGKPKPRSLKDLAAEQLGLAIQVLAWQEMWMGVH